MRGLFIARPGHRLVGYDAAGLEARVMGHYTYPIDGGEFANELLNGDIHTKNRDWISKIYPIDRDVSKNIFYGLCYGAQPPKIRETSGGCSKKQSKLIWDGFWDNNPGLGRLREKVIRLGTKYGYLQGIDGRKIWLRGSEHAWLNALFQSAGAIAMNYSLVILDEWCKEENVKRIQCAYYHDEAVDEVPNEDIIIVDDSFNKGSRMVSKCGGYYSRFGELAVESIREAGKRLGFRCALDSDYQIGNSWAEIH